MPLATNLGACVQAHRSLDQRTGQNIARVQIIASKLHIKTMAWFKIA
jgi:hypothetical protein